MKAKILIVLVVVTILLTVILTLYFSEEKLEKLSGESELNILNITEKIDPTCCVSPYQEFIKKNKQYSKPISEIEFNRQLQLARQYINHPPYIILAENLKEKIIEVLNIGFLLEGLDQRELVVTTTGMREYEEYVEKELLFEDPEVGNFSVLLLIPKLGEEPYPAIVGLHGHIDSKEFFKYNFFGEDLVKEGFVVIMPSFRAMHCDELEEITSKELLLEGFSLMGMRVYETHLLIKYLKYLDFVDENKIGIIGHSGGGDAANLVTRISEDIKAEVFDATTDFLDICPGGYMHCETLPALTYYTPQIRDFSTLDVPFREFEYAFTGSNDKEEVINFFKENLIYSN